MIHFGHESVGGFMRGRFRDQGGLFSYLSPETRVPAKHPLRQVRELVRAVLKDLSPSFGKLYSSAGRPSIPPEQLLSALLLQVFYGIRSERQLMEQLDYNLLYRWFVGLSPDDPIWDPTTFTKNRDRLQTGAVFAKFMSKLLNHPEVKPLLSDEHFSVDGTLIEAWALAQEFPPQGRQWRRRRRGRLPRPAAQKRYACEHQRSRLPSLPQGRRAGSKALLHGPRHHGEPPWAGGGGHGHARRRHCRAPRFADHAQGQSQGGGRPHHGGRR